METAIILGAIVQIITLTVFFVMAANLSKLTKLTKAQLDRTLFDAPDYLKMMGEINQIEMPMYRESSTDVENYWVMFGEDEERFAICREFGRYSCFFGEKEVYFRTKEDAIKGLYLHKEGKI